MKTTKGTPKTPYFGACPIDFKAVTPGLAAPHKKIVETHASQSRAILSNLRTAIAEDNDEKSRREQKRCTAITKSIKKLKAERIKSQADVEKQHADCLAWLAAQEEELAHISEQIEKEKARQAAWQTKFKQQAQKSRKEIVLLQDSWLSSLK